MARQPGTAEPWDKAQVGRRIWAFREAKQWSQTYLATILGPPFTPQKINNYESGRDLLPPHMAGRLCAVTALDMNYLYQGQLDGLPDRMQISIAKKLAEAPRTPSRRGLDRP